MRDLSVPRAMTFVPDEDRLTPDFVITIAINNNSNIHGIAYRPNLLVAKTIAHEVIHAEMYRKLLSLANQGNLDFNSWTNQQHKDYILRDCLKFVFGICYRAFFRQLRLENRSLATLNEDFGRKSGGKKAITKPKDEI